MEPFLIIKLEIVTQPTACFAWTSIVVQIDLLPFDGAPQSLGENIVQRAAASIHSDLPSCREQDTVVLRRGKLPALVTIEDKRVCHRQCPFDRRHNKRLRQGLIQLPTDNVAREPIQ